MLAKLPQLKGSSQWHTGSLKKTGSFDWLQPAERLLAAVGNPTKKKGDSVYGFIGVRWRPSWEPVKNKGQNLSDVPHLHRASSSE